MLVISRKKSERVLLSGGIAITVLKVKRGIVQLGIEAPGDIGIARDELADDWTPGDGQKPLDVAKAG